MRDTTAVTQLRSTAQEEPGWLVAAQRPGVTLGTLSAPLAQREKWLGLPRDPLAHLSHDANWTTREGDG